MHLFLDCHGTSWGRTRRPNLIDNPECPVKRKPAAFGVRRSPPLYLLLFSLLLAKGEKYAWREPLQGTLLSSLSAMKPKERDQSGGDRRTPKAKAGARSSGSPKLSRVTWLWPGKNLRMPGTVQAIPNAPPDDDPP